MEKDRESSDLSFPLGSVVFKENWLKIKIIRIVNEVGIRSFLIVISLDVFPRWIIYVILFTSNDDMTHWHKHTGIEVIKHLSCSTEN